MRGRPGRVAAIALIVAVVVAGSTSGSAAERVAGAQAELVSARRLIEEAQGRYGRLPIGPSSLELYRQYSEQYGFSAESFMDVCIGLVASSLAKVGSADELEAEFARTLRFRNGLLGVYGPLAQKWGLDGSATPGLMDQAISDTEERRLFKTSLLADTMATVWSFVLGYQYFRLYGESPPQLSPDQSPVDQGEIDQRLRDLAGEIGR